MAAILKKNCGSEKHFDSTIMFTTSNYPKILIFIENGQSCNSHDMVAILKKKMSTKKKFDEPSHVPHPKYSMFQFELSL